VTFEKADEVVAAYESGRCDVFTTDRSSLAAQRTKLKNPEAHVVLPEIISKEPLGPLVRHGDDQWLDIVRWSLYAMLEAEEYGVNSENVDQMKSGSNDPVVKRLLGVEGDMGKNLGLGNDWAYNIIKKVGNYGESYERNVGPKTPLKLERGANALWKDGGLQYAMPVR
jgi:general L-amino acid transport system substrate-binding protein